MKLDDRFLQEQGRVYLTGIQALVRLPADQMRRDRQAGLKTASYISGYEGSPLGGYDLALLRNRKLLDQYEIHVRPALNEDLAATAVWGTQMLDSLGPNPYDGIVGFWYGKGPGVDRTGDAFRHANFVGCSKQNAAVILAGDDPTSKSSTIPHQSDFSLYNLNVPTLYPGNVQEILDYGLYAVALSRFAGCWSGMKLVTNVCDGGGMAAVDPQRIQFRIPAGYEKRNDLRLMPPVSVGVEYEVNVRRMEAVRQFVRENPINQWTGARGGAKLGILTAGKPYFDLMQALSDLGVSTTDLLAYGIRIAKLGVTFPIDRAFVREFAEGLETILVVEEKRSFLELQLRELLYDLAVHPAVIGKFDGAGKPLFPQHGELDPDLIAAVLVSRLDLPRGSERMARIAAAAERPKDLSVIRGPNFCSGCPHNRSTLLPAGAAAGGGIGCHGMSFSMGDTGRGYAYLTQMGGEGAPWIGMSPFSDRKHTFQHIGDGTYFHSGAMAISACIAAKVNITFKLMHNGHVAMTGGQAAVGAIPVPDLTRRLEAEGVKKTIVIADDLERYKDARFAGNAELRDRSTLMASQEELARIPGVTFLIYDQQCAAEKRRMRSRGSEPEPVKRLVIHEQVCEGCGDCVRESNCASLQPVETPLGDKMRIHQSSCNKDYTCAMGDCPSFLTVEIAAGTGLKKPQPKALANATPPPAPQQQPKAGGGYRILCPGIGGTGVVTINALIATAAVLDGLSMLTLDQTGLAQKGGTVVSHLVLSEQPIEAANKINTGNANVILGFDLLGVTGPDNLKCAAPEHTVAVINTHITPTPESVRKKTVLAGPETMLRQLESVTLRGRNVYVDATRLAESLFGSHLAANVFLLGVAFQAGLIPVTQASLEEAIRLNNVSVDLNLKALLWGRKYFVNAQEVELAAGHKAAPRSTESQPLPLTAEYEAWLARVPEELRPIVRRNLSKLVHYKDEYEVARLLTDSQVEAEVLAMWDQPVKLSYNLHPPLLRRFGIDHKIQLGPWFKPALKLLAHMSWLRGTWLDPFGWTSHRRAERALIPWYQNLVTEALPFDSPANRAAFIELLMLPDQIRGYESIKEASIRKVQAAAGEKLGALRNPCDKMAYATSGKIETETHTG